MLPREWAVRYAAHVSTIRHGRDTCLARRPRCEACVLRGLCPSAGLFLGGDTDSGGMSRRRKLSSSGGEDPSLRSGEGAVSLALE